MVATDIAGRGLDFNHVSHVINYDYPVAWYPTRTEQEEPGEWVGWALP